MVGFLPVNTVLNTLNEKNSFSHTISYTDNLGVSYPVTITPSEINNTVTISGGLISGNYTNVFDETIDYRIINEDSRNDEFKTVYSFNDISINNFEIYHYNASAVTSKTYTYIAEANGQTQSYTIIVENDWSTGRNELRQKLGLSPLYAYWVNISNQRIKWINASGIEVNWR